ncbi:hypothetical protein [Spirosoma arcticum]
MPLLCVLMSVVVCAQPDFSKLKTQFEDGIFLRMAELGYVKSTSVKDTITIEPNFVETYVFLRFEKLDTIRIDKDTALIGRVFMSNRYLGDSMATRYPTAQSFKKDTNGFYYMCKIHGYLKDSRKLNQVREESKPTVTVRVNIYPDYVVNVCRGHKFPLCDPAFGVTGSCKTLTEHYGKLKKMALIDDTSFQDIIRQKTENQKDSCEKQVNFRKFVKYFEVDLSTESTNELAGISLRYTKYELSEDLIQQNQYSYTYLNLQKELELPNAFAEIHKRIKERNGWQQTSHDVVAQEPANADTSISGKEGWVDKTLTFGNQLSVADTAKRVNTEKRVYLRADFPKPVKLAKENSTPTFDLGDKGRVIAEKTPVTILDSTTVGEEKTKWLKIRVGSTKEP